MPDKLLLCTDLDRTLIPNGHQAESPMARNYFSRLTARPEVVLAYVSGRHRELVQEAIKEYHLPVPDFVIADVGTTIYRVGQSQEWERQIEWESEIAADWNGKSHADLEEMLQDIPGLRLQEPDKQNSCKLSYYVSLQADQAALATLIEQRLKDAKVKSNFIWSVDEPAATGLLDILPASASKLHAVEMLMHMHGFSNYNTMFCGDSGNDMEVLVSPIPAVVVANSHPDVKEQAALQARENGYTKELYIATGGFQGMNGNYSAGILEGMVHYYPWAETWVRPAQDGSML